MVSQLKHLVDDPNKQSSSEYSRMNDSKEESQNNVRQSEEGKFSSTSAEEREYEEEARSHIVGPYKRSSGQNSRGGKIVPMYAYRRHLETRDQPQKVETPKDTLTASRKSHTRGYSQAEILTSTTRLNGLQIPRSNNHPKTNHVSSKYVSLTFSPN